MNLSRRNLLVGASSVAASALLPTLPLPTPAAAQTPSLLAYAVGTPGEFDWQAVRAASPEEAFKEWVWSRWGDDEDAPAFDPEFVNRIEKWDDRPEIKPADWFDADLGYCCERCGYESHPDTGARVVAGEVVCEECLTLADRILTDPNEVVEDLGNRIADEGADEVRAHLEYRKEWEVLPDDLWQRSLAFAAEDFT